MTTLYKLTDERGQTYGETLWGPGIEYTAPGVGPLCSEGWLHAYTDPLLAMLLNPIHANFPQPRLWEADGDIGLTDHGLKVGCTRLRTIQELPLPAVTTEQWVRFGILCAWEVCWDVAWRSWASRWLDGSDRSRAAAWVAESSAWEAMELARAAWRSVAWWAAKSSAESAARAAESELAWAVESAPAVAELAACAVEAAARIAALDLPALARRAMLP